MSTEYELILNANKIFGQRAISPLTFEGLAQQPPASTWRGYLPGLPETTTMPQVQNEIWNDLRRPALQDSVFHRLPDPQRVEQCLIVEEVGETCYPQYQRLWQEIKCH